MVKPFASLLRQGKVAADDIDDFVDYWNDNDTGRSLHEFLGMSKSEFVAWLKTDNSMLYAILGIELKMPVCKMCGMELGMRLNDGRIVCRSSYIENNDYCHECQVEHCVNTNCLKCDIGEYPNCRHLDLKRCYLESKRIEQDGEQKSNGQEEGGCDGC